MVLGAFSPQERDTLPLYTRLFGCYDPVPQKRETDRL